MPRFRSPVLKLKTAHEIAFSPAEKRVALFGGRDVKVLEHPSAKVVFSVHPTAHPSSIDFSPDGRQLVVKSTSGRTLVLDGQTGRTVSDFRNQKEGEGAAALFSKCGRYVVSVSWDGLLSVRDVATTELVFSRLDKECMLSHLSAPKDRRFFVYSVGSLAPSDSQPTPPEKVMLQPWPFRGDEFRELPRRWSNIDALCVSPSGRLLAVVHGAPPENLEIYDLERSRVISRRAVHSGCTYCSLGWSPDERLLATTGDHRCFVLEMPKLRVRHEFALRYPCYVGFSPSSRFLALGSWAASFIVPLDYLPEFAATRQQEDKPANRWLRK